jgi:hypothetical protein
VPRFGDVKLLSIPTRIETVCSDARRDKSDLDERVAIYQEDAIRMHVGHIEDLAVRGETDVLRHAPFESLRKPMTRRLTKSIFTRPPSYSQVVISMGLL